MRLAYNLRRRFGHEKERAVANYWKKTRAQAVDAGLFLPHGRD